MSDSTRSRRLGRYLSGDHQMLPAGYPMTVAMLRALPAGLLLMLFIRQLPKGIWWGRIFVLRALNFAVFWWLLFVSAYRLPGGVAATVGAIQPLIVLLLSRMVLGNVLKPLAVLGALCGIGGVALLLLTPQAKLDAIGIIAGLAGAFSMAAGTVLNRRWQPDVSPLTLPLAAHRRRITAAAGLFCCLNWHCRR